MNECCKDRHNLKTIKGSQDYNEDGRIIEFINKCKICGDMQKWICINSENNTWEKQLNFKK